MNKQMNPRIKSEISGRLTGTDDNIRKLFGLDEVHMTGQDLETLTCAIWMVGYSEALTDITELKDTKVNITPLLAKWGITDG